MTDKKDVKIKYIIPPDLKDQHVNGVYGGVSMRGDVQLHFYSERPAIPKETVFEIDEKNGSILPNTAKDRFGANFIRLIQSSITMDINTAINIKNWLVSVLEPIEKKVEGDQNEE